MVINLLCGKSDQPLKTFIFRLWESTVFLNAEDWSNYVNHLLDCPHPLAGKTMKAGSVGPNPYIFTDYDRNIQYDENGKPLGTNTGVAETLGQVFGFKTRIIPMKTYDYIDPKTKQWMGVTGEVKNHFISKIKIFQRRNTGPSITRHFYSLFQDLWNNGCAVFCKVL